MEDNVALDSNKQKQFVKSVKGLKKLIKKNEDENAEGVTDNTPKPKKNGKNKERGLVYLSHIPHGFYEDQMTQYFKQFGRVTNVRVIRSKRTGKSKGHAFVEFSEPAVGQIVAETMNNYLMGKRLIKAAYIPPEKQRRAFRKRWNEVNNPGVNAKNKLRKAFNDNKTEEQERKKALKLLHNLNKNKKKLKQLGIDYDFFTAVDIPENLSIKSEVKDESKENKANMQNKKKKKSNDSADKLNKNNIETNKKEKVVSEPGVKKSQKLPNSNSIKSRKELKVQQLEQKDRKQKLKDVGVKPPENFIKIAQSNSDDDSDSSIEFDSDEFDKAQEFDDDFDSDSEGSELDENTGSEDDEPNSEPELPRSKVQPKKDAVKKPSFDKVNTQKTKEKDVKKQINKTEEMKRKAPQKPPANAKKQKFEKKSNQKKLFKLKK